MQHQHVLAEHEHFAVHRRRIRQPTRAGAFAAHGIGKVHRRVHRHLHMRHVVRFVSLHAVHLMRLMRHRSIAVMLMHIVRLGGSALRFCLSFLFLGNQLHAAFRAIAGTICDDFGMHRACVFLLLLFLVLMPLLLLVIAGRALGVNRSHFCNRGKRHRASD